MIFLVSKTNFNVRNNMNSRGEEHLRVSVDTSDVLHDGLVLERQVLKELSKRVKAVVDVIIIGITSD